MSKSIGRVTSDLTISADGYSAGPGQTEERPFGEDGVDGSGAKLYAWMFAIPDENRAKVDQITAAKAFIMGRNMFGPVREGWDRQGTARRATIRRSTSRSSCSPTRSCEPQAMDGGSTYYFVTDRIDSALAQALEAACDRDVSIHRGATTINQYLAPA